MAHAPLRPRLCLEEPQVEAPLNIGQRRPVNLSGPIHDRLEWLMARCELRSGRIDPALLDRRVSPLFTT